MNKRYMVYLYPLLVIQIATFLLSLFVYHDISLLHYINISFYISFLFILFSLIIYTINSGFFDTTSHSFQKVFAKYHVSNEQEDEMLPLSQLITTYYPPLLITGIIQLLLTLVSLFLFYI